MRSQFFKSCHCLLIPLILSQTISVKGQSVDTLKLGENLIANVSNSVSRYLVVTVNNDKPLPVSIVERTVKVNPAKNSFSSTIRSFNLDTTKNDVRTSVALVRGILPVSNAVSNGPVTMTTLFSKDSILLKMDSIKTGTSRKLSFHQLLKGYDFELDYEMLASLPWKEQYKVAIPFYQPGTKGNAKYYLYEVVGSEDYKADGYPAISCWKIMSKSYTSGLCTWWISKKDKQVLKESRERPGQKFTIRTLISY